VAKNQWQITTMYEAYWQLDAKPFECTSDVRFYYPGESHQAALLKLRYAIENKREAALLAGPAGTGKTLLIAALTRLLPPHCQPLVHLVFPQMPPDQLVAYITNELTGETSAQPESIERNIRRLQHVLRENVAAKRQAVLVVDEAHLLRDTSALETLRLLLNLQVDGAPAMTMVLVGQTVLLPALDRQPELDERLGVKCLLRRFELEETMAYVSHRLSAAGAKRPIFDTTALEAVHHLSHGVARQINRLCDLALLIGYADERPGLFAAQIEAVADELVTIAPE
jgi:type II secretory pathway predicted ATPase ExeA